MSQNISDSERQQLLDTVTMFERIIITQPLDCESLEVLGQAHMKLGNIADGLRVAKKIVAAREKLNQVPQAITECKRMLRSFPDDPELKATLERLLKT